MWDMDKWNFEVLRFGNTATHTHTPINKSLLYDRKPSAEIAPTLAESPKSGEGPLLNSNLLELYVKLNRINQKLYFFDFGVAILS